MVLKSTKLSSAGGRRGHHRYSKQERDFTCCSWLDDEGLRWKDVRAVSRSRKWILAGSQERIRNVRSLAARNWILPVNLSEPER